MEFHLQNSPMAVIEWDDQFRVKRWNRKAEQIFGWAAHEVRGRRPSDWKFVFEDDQERVAAALRSMAAGGPPCTAVKNRNYTRDGRVIHSEWNSSALLDEQGKLVSILSLVQNITERVEAEEARRKMQDRSQQILSAVSDAYIFFDLQWRFVDLNPFAEKVLGRPRHQLIGQSFWQVTTELVKGPEKDAFEKGLMRAFQRKGREEFDYHLSLQRRDYRVQAIASVDGLSVFLTDVTESRRRERELAESESRFRTLAEAIPQMVWIASPDGLVEYVNENTTRYTGLPVKDVLRDQAGAIIHPEDMDSSNLLWTRSVETGTAYETQYRIRRGSDGTYRWHLVRGVPVRDSAGNIIKWFGTCTDIHDSRQLIEDLRRAERMIKENEQRLSAALSTAELGLFDWNIESQTVFWSDTQKRLFGYEPDAKWEGEMPTPQPWWDRVHRDDQAQVKNMLRTALLGRQPETLTYRVVWPDGTIKYLLARSRVFFDESGRSVRCLGTSIDITREKESEAFFKALADSIPQIVFVADEHGQVVSHNRRQQEFTGIPEEELRGSNWFRIVHPEDMELMRAAWKRSLREGRPFLAEGRLRRADGIYVWHLLQALPYRDAVGRILRWFGTATSIQDQKRVQENQRFLSEATRMLSASVDPDEVLRTGARLAMRELCDGVSADFVPELASGLRISLGGGPGQPGPEPDPQWIERVRSTGNSLQVRTEAGCVLAVPLRARGAINGVLTYFKWSARAEFTAEQAELADKLAVRIGLAIENARLFQQLQEAVKVRDEFLSIASHELKTPLTSIMLQNQLLGRLVQARYTDAAALADPAAREKILHCLRISERQLWHLAELIDDLLDVSRIANGKMGMQPQAANLNTIVKEALDHFSEQMRAVGMSVNLIGCENAAGIWDRARIHQCVINLLSNAVKYGAGAPIEVRVWDDGEQCGLAVKDQGLGIDPQHVDRIFDRFERAVNGKRISGLGLGLYITKEIVTAHAGTIRVESELGHGSTFEILLPKDPFHKQVESAVPGLGLTTDHEPASHSYSSCSSQQVAGSGAG